MGEKLFSTEHLNKRDAQNIQSMWREVDETDARINLLAFNATQSSAETTQRMKEVDALIEEGNNASENTSVNLRKKRKSPIEVPLFTFHGGSSDSDGGAPTGQEKDRRSASYWERKQNSRMTLKNR